MEDNRTISGSTFGDGARLHQGDNYYYGPPEPGERCLVELYITDPRRDKKRIEDTKGGLLADCYRWILENDNFLQWHNDPQARLLWIKGDPGKGKTMLLCGIIEELDKTSSKPIYFFCQATDNRLNSATAVLRGLIWFLVIRQPTLITYLQAEYSHAGKRLFEDANAWYALSQMLISMLADPVLDNQILIVDALDECVADLRRLLDFLSKSSSSRAKWIVSSRNWSTIELALERTSQLCLELNEDAISTAVRAYIQHKVNQLASKNKYDGSTVCLVQSYLISNANDTFLWVALVCHQLIDVRSRHVPYKMNSFPPGLNALYDRMMSYMFQSDDAVLCRQILAATSVVYRPVSLKELIALIPSLEKYGDDVDTMEEIVGACGSFLTLRAGVINFVQKFAKDFLLERASEKILPFGIAYEHKSIFLRLIEVLHGTLRRDLHGLRNLSLSIDQTSPPSQDPLAPTRYSCIYWVDHFCAAKPSARNNLNNEADAEVIYEFLHKKFIYWLEALAVMHSLSEGVMATRTLEEWAEKCKGSRQLLGFIQDAHRFILSHKTAIEIAPMQVYASALVFSPTRSLVREAFKRQIPKWIIMQPTVPADWDACLSTLEGHDSKVNLVIFTAGGQRLASVSRSGTVKIWDLATGTCVLTLKGHIGSVESVVFIANDQQLASASHDASVKIWDLTTGSCLLTFDGYGDKAGVTAFTNDGGRLALGYRNGAIKIRDLARGAFISMIPGHSDTVWSFAFTTDGQQLASGSKNGAVKIWDTVSGACMLTLKGHRGRVRSVAFTADGRWLASGSLYGLIKLWDLTTSACVSMLKGHSGPVLSVAYTENGQRLISGSYDSTIKIWDPARDTDTVRLVAFTADGRRLASGSEDETVKIWDSVSGVCVLTLEDHRGTVWSVALTADGNRLASGSEDGKIRIWGMARGTCVVTLDGHGDAVAFTADDRRLASKSWDGTVRMWDPDTGACISTLEGHGNPVGSVMFTADGQRLASGSFDGTVKIWAPNTGSFISVSSTVDGQRLTFKSDDGVVEIWDTATAAFVSTLREYVEEPKLVTFSENGQRLASGHWDGTIRVWNADTKECVSMFEGHSDTISDVKFTADSQRLVSASYDGTVRLWDLATNECLSTLKHHDPASISISSASSKSTFQEGISLQGYGISKDGTYIMKGRKRVLWLPVEYRSSEIAVFGETIAIGCKLGRVVFIKFSAEDIEI
ncbi:NACHT and WD40 domain protein [Colletotrichum incanum]|nr:NACHT and WD40 domain protein [Colletotrichum incanum]